MKKDEALADIQRRNAGRPTLTVWSDGTYVIHGSRDAELTLAGEIDFIHRGAAADDDIYNNLRKEANALNQIGPARRGRQFMILEGTDIVLTLDLETLEPMSQADKS